MRDADGTLHMVKTGSDRKNEVECNVMGRECKIKSPDGKPATVSFYFNGPKLIEWEKAGDKVVKRRFTAVDADTLEVETTSIVPNGNQKQCASSESQIHLRSLQTPSKKRLRGATFRQVAGCDTLGA